MKNWSIASLLIIVFFGCNEKYISPQKYNVIELYKFTKKPWDKNVEKNQIYNSTDLKTNSNLYSNLGAHDFILIYKASATKEIDSLIFNKNLKEFIPENPRCPAGNRFVAKLINGKDLKYIINFNDYCDRVSIVDLNTNSTRYSEISSDIFIKILNK